MTWAFQVLEGSILWMGRKKKEDAHLMSTTIQPSKNAPIEASCQSGGCERPAVADAKTYWGPWGYWCGQHLEEVAVGVPNLITNITTEPLVLSWL